VDGHDWDETAVGFVRFKLGCVFLAAGVESKTTCFLSVPATTVSFWCSARLPVRVRWVASGSILVTAVHVSHDCGIPPDDMSSTIKALFVIALLLARF